MTKSEFGCKWHVLNPRQENKGLTQTRQVKPCSWRISQVPRETAAPHPCLLDLLCKWIFPWTIVLILRRYDKSCCFLTETGIEVVKYWKVLMLNAAYSSLPQGHVRQTNLVQVVFQKCNTPRTKRIWAVAVVGSKKMEDDRQTIDYQQDYPPTITPPFIPLATIPIPFCIPDSELLANTMMPWLCEILHKYA